MNLFDILFMQKTGKIKPDADLFDIMFAKVTGVVERLVTIIGNPLSFITKKAQTAVSTKVTLEPIQAGSGNPSPTNIRPISGRSSVEIKCADGESVVHDTVTISFGETVYSGTLDVEQGQVLVDKEYVNFSTITINKNNNDSDNWNYYLRKTSFSYSSNMICSHLVYKSTIPTTSIGLSSRLANRAIYMNFLDAIGVNDVSHFRQFCIDNNVQLVCERATPTTIQLTPSQIQILKGQNTIWIEDEGAQIELSYMN